MSLNIQKTTKQASNLEPHKVVTFLYIFSRAFRQCITPKDWSDANLVKDFSKSGIQKKKKERETFGNRCTCFVVNATLLRLHH